MVHTRTLGILVLSIYLIDLVGCSGWRAINGTALWSRYNLINRDSPYVVAVGPETTTVDTGSQVEGSSSTDVANLPIAPRQEEYEEDSEEDDEDDDDEEALDDLEDEIGEESHDVYGEDIESFSGHASTTQRSHKKRKRYKKRKTRKGGIRIKGLKKLRKYMLPLLLAYKLKFLMMIPLLLGGLVLLVGTTGFAGFFFALFAIGLGLKKD